MFIIWILDSIVHMSTNVRICPGNSKSTPISKWPARSELFFEVLVWWGVWRKCIPSVPAKLSASREKKRTKKQASKLLQRAACFADGRIWTQHKERARGQRVSFYTGQQCVRELLKALCLDCTSFDEEIIFFDKYLFSTLLWVSDRDFTKISTLI